MNLGVLNLAGLPTPSGNARNATANRSASSELPCKKTALIVHVYYEDVMHQATDVSFVFTVRGEVNYREPISKTVADSHLARVYVKRNGNGHGFRSIYHEGLTTTFQQLWHGYYYNFLWRETFRLMFLVRLVRLKRRGN